MSKFPESIKKLVKAKAHFQCCRCRNIGVEVHHIIPQKDGGPNNFDNAAPLCKNCHTDFGDNPMKRKEIKEMRDWWYKKCDEMYKSIVILKEKTEPKILTKEFPVVFFYHKESGDLYWSSTNKFSNYYHGAAFAVQELKNIHPKKYQKIVSDKNFYATFFIDLIERLIFAWFSLSYQVDWLLERKKWKFPWAEVGHASKIDHPEIEAETINYLGIRGFKKNIFSEVSMDFGSFTVPKGTKITISRDTEHPKAVITMENNYYNIQFNISFSSWLYQMGTPEWLSGLTKEQQKEFATVTYNIRFQAEPNGDKSSEDKMRFYQKWVEDICQEIQDQFDWLTTLNHIKNEQIFKIREILDRLKI